jgi:hypothetical protein
VTINPPRQRTAYYYLRVRSSASRSDFDPAFIGGLIDSPKFFRWPGTRIRGADQRQ